MKIMMRMRMRMLVTTYISTIDSCSMTGKYSYVLSSTNSM